MNKYIYKITYMNTIDRYELITLTDKSAVVKSPVYSSRLEEEKIIALGDDTCFTLDEAMDIVAKKKRKELEVATDKVEDFEAWFSDINRWREGMREKYKEPQKDQDGYCGAQDDQPGKV